MLNSNAYLLIFAVAFMGCVLVTPLVTRLATWLGAIDRPDQFRRIHKGATPRLGGLGLAFGVTAAVVVAALGGYFREWSEFPRWIATLLPIGMAALIVLTVGVVDDTREMKPGLKLMGQAAAVLALYLGGVRIDGITVFELNIPLDSPSFVLPLPGQGIRVALPGLMVTMLWFLACMNIWNLIDGMDGLASGVGLLVSGTLALVAIWVENPGAAILSAALAGGLAGFLLYNWHPACIFLGDSGSLLIGLLIGIIGVQGSLKEGATISILFPILAMGLPITDTAMAIFRRWVRNLPLSSADRRHVHHLLIGLGLNPRQAAALLYCFSAGLCGVVLLGVVYKNEPLALVMGLSGCAAFLLILTSRRDELATLRADLASRNSRKRQERYAAKVTWEAIQRVELCETTAGIWEILRASTTKLGCDDLRLDCRRDGHDLFDRAPRLDAEASGLSGPRATFRLSGGRDLSLVVSLGRAEDGSGVEPDIAFRFLQRLSLASAERLDRLGSPERAGELLGAGEAARPASGPAEGPRASAEGLVPSSSRAAPIEAAAGAGVGVGVAGGLAALELDRMSWSRPSLGWLRVALGWSTVPVPPARPLGED